MTLAKEVAEKNEKTLETSLSLCFEADKGLVQRECRHRIWIHLKEIRSIRSIGVRLSETGPLSGHVKQTGQKFATSGDC